METLKKNLANLLKVKTIVTLLLTIVFCVLSLKGVINGQEFLTVFSIVIAFYYGTQSAKNTTATDSLAEVKAVHVNEQAVLPGAADMKPPDNERTEA